MMDFELDKDAASPREELQAQELKLWKQWKRTGDPHVMGAIVDSMKPIIQQTVSKFRDVTIPPSAIEAEAMKHVVDGIRTYDPRQGVKLSTYVYSRMPKVNRFVYEHQNVGRIPEHRILKINAYNAAREELRMRVGREPSAVELSDELGWDLKEVERMERELRKEVIGSVLEAGGSDFSFLGSSETNRVLNYIYYELSPQERVVFENVSGYAGKPILKDDREIARKAGITVEDVKRLKRSIAQKIERRM